MIPFNADCQRSINGKFDIFFYIDNFARLKYLVRLFANKL
jgi:hypothetical protein